MAEDHSITTPMERAISGACLVRDHGWSTVFAIQFVHRTLMGLSNNLRLAGRPIIIPSHAQRTGEAYLMVFFIAQNK